MNQQPDKFFREKLYGHQEPVSADTWNRISQRLVKKNNRRIWLRAAAAILFLATGTLLFYPGTRRNPTQRLSEIAPPTRDQQAPVPRPDSQEIAPRQSTDTPADCEELRKESTSKKDETEPRLTNTPRRRSLPAPRLQLPDIGEAMEDEQHDIPVPLMAKNDTAPQEAKAPVEENNAKAKNLIIVFTREEVNRKYLIKKTEAQATREGNESSGLRKLLDKASDLKHNQDPLGDLRQMKNEILAMNFRNDKRTEND